MSTGSGYARVYELVGSSFTQLGGTIDTIATPNFALAGTSVAMNAAGDRVAVGSPIDGANDVGIVRIYDFVASGWQQVGGDIPGSARDCRAGASVDLSADGSRVAIGAPDTDVGTDASAGQARVFEFAASAWSQIGQNMNGAASFDNFGNSVSLNELGDRLLVGSPAPFGFGGTGGSATLFQYDGSTWKQLSKIEEVLPSDLTGSSVALSGDGKRASVGSPGNSPGTSAGLARVFDLESC